MRSSCAVHVGIALRCLTDVCGLVVPSRISSVFVACPAAWDYQMYRVTDTVKSPIAGRDPCFVTLASRLALKTSEVDELLRNAT